jgi:hypothetical protein
MSNFNIFVNNLLTELANVAGGAGAVTGPVTSGNTGNQFPAQNDTADAPGDVRVPSILGNIKTKKRKKASTQVQRRSVYLPGM